ncbi:MAG: RDD family protein [Candidatus Nanopelagicales bacterium]|nr:RDD family protein [Candidatus Nanopelagicales bacterium]
MDAELPDRVPVVAPHVPDAAREFQGLRAGIVSRVIANAVDVAVVVLIAFSGYIGLAAGAFLLDPQGFTFPPLHPNRMVLVCGALLFLYFWASWAMTGRTVGNRLMGLRVVSFRGRLMRWSGAFLRALFCVALPIGLFWAVVSRQNRSIQDVVLRSSVIYDWGRTQDRPAREPAQH